MNVRTSSPWWRVALAAWILVLAGCSGPTGTGPPDPDAPTVSATAPVAGATGVARNAAIAVTFSTSMEPMPTEAAFGVSPGVACRFAWNIASTRLTCHPEGLLVATATHAVTIGTGATSTSGRPLGATHRFTFTTGDTVLPPCVFGATAATFGGCVFGP